MSVPVGARGSRVGLFRMFLAERRDPEPFYRQLAVETVASLPFPVDGRTILDLGCGAGYYGKALCGAGAVVVGVDLDAASLADRVEGAPTPMLADARRLPLHDNAVDGVLCSNLLEHTPDPAAVIAEIERVVRPGGWVWLSWTNWYSPWGGHAIAPFHYLGPRAGLAARRRLLGEPRGRNLPFDGLWPTHIGQVLGIVRSRAGLELLDARPRYYPSQRWIMKIPGFREVAAWNCLLILRKRANDRNPSRPEPGGTRHPR